MNPMPAEHALLVRLATFAAACALVGASGCGLNPQPLPPDSPMDAGGFLSTPAADTDAGHMSASETAGSSGTGGGTDNASADAGGAVGPADGSTVIGPPDAAAGGGGDGSTRAVDGAYDGGARDGAVPVDGDVEHDAADHADAAREDASRPD